MECNMEFDANLDNRDLLSFDSYPQEPFDFSPYISETTGEQIGEVSLIFTEKPAADVLFGNQNGQASWIELIKLRIALAKDPNLVLRWRSPVCFYTNQDSECASQGEVFDFDFSTYTVSLEITLNSGNVSQLMWPRGTTFVSVYDYFLTPKQAPILIEKNTWPSRPAPQS